MLTQHPDQAKTRQTVTFTDQHGRPWLTVLDARAKSAGGDPQIAPCVPFSPKGWSAPLDVPQKYLTVPAGSLGVLAIDYDRWIADLREAERAWRQNFQTAAFQLYGQAAAAAIQHPPPELVNLVGRGPLPVTFVQAARSGKSRWVLGLPQPTGLPYPVPAWAAPILDQLLDTPAADEDDAQFADDVFADELTPAPADLAGDAAVGMANPYAEDPFAPYPGADVLDPYGDLEDEVDPAATGGSTQRVGADRHSRSHAGGRKPRARAA